MIGFDLPFFFFFFFFVMLFIIVTSNIELSMYNNDPV